MNQEERTTRKTKTGTVVSNKMQNTVVVKIQTTMQHPRYSKVVTREKKFYAHSTIEGIKEGDKVVITETRPISKLKRWRVVEKIEPKNNSSIQG